MKKDSVEDLNESVNKLEERIEKTNDPKRVFLFGVLAGFGRAIGATILFGLVVTIVSAVLYKVGLFPELNEMLNSIISP